MNSSQQEEKEEDQFGPSVDSTDMEERIAARRLRIKKRLEAIRRAEMGEDLDANKQIEEELSRSRKQMEKSRIKLTKLREDGVKLVTNIRVGADAREQSRRLTEEDSKRHRKERLDGEAKAGGERFEEITRKWESALQKEIPQDLYEMLTQQKNGCDALIEEKNKLINDFQSELKNKDNEYVKDLKKMAHDIDLMLIRMDEQVKKLTESYRKELMEIENEFVLERNELLETQGAKWELTMKCRRDKEEEYLKSREKRVEDHEKQLRHKRIADAEEYNKVKIQLETDVQNAEQQLQQLRATYQLNQEKLEYNFQVLRKRDEENTITKSQQKRKITRLQDVLTNLKAKLAKQEKQYKDENANLTDDYKRLTDQFKELQKKSRHFLGIDAAKFRDVWIMNENEAKDYLNKVLECDKLIHEQQLGMAWPVSDIAFTENIGPLASEEQRKKNTITAHQVAEEILSTNQSRASEEWERKKSAILEKFPPVLIKKILELLCDESGFLIEEKLNRLLEPLEANERCLMKLDSIFSALKVDTADDVDVLSKYFVHITEPKEDQNENQNEERGEEEEPDEGVEEGDMEDETSSENMQSKDTLIHPNLVLKALRQFVEDNRQQAKVVVKSAEFEIASLKERDASEDQKYWMSYPAVLTEEKKQIWSALSQGLEKYHDVLASRANLLTETDSLRQQNAELRMLLHQYVNSKVNKELEIPPTKVLQFELNN
ncbi:DgyrCDS4859 [Dimorphilus gyrociliatus]|uniref:DgyrCDS4859 n=1 Tax=Dimorphilus gyrociliatus TaxID=2664684 RepID=A0A7I8VKG1_9ANNE|nr:DgyrCDS4859 [Dimorphilus gyrociliatus]